MKKSRFGAAKIMEIMDQAEGGVLVLVLCRVHRMGHASFYTRTWGLPDDLGSPAFHSTDKQSSH